MATVFLSLGSNMNREKHIGGALDALSTLFGTLRISKVYESESVGFIGDHFINLAVAIETSMPVGVLSACLKNIEDQHGRDRSAAKFAGRSLDIDILTYDDTCGVIDNILLPREEILKNAFVLQPMVDIAPDTLHPVVKRSYTQLWANYDNPQQKLWPVSFIWGDKTL